MKSTNISTNAEAQCSDLKEEKYHPEYYWGTKKGYKEIITQNHRRKWYNSERRTKVAKFRMKKEKWGEEGGLGKEVSCYNKTIHVHIQGMVHNC